MSDWLSWLYLLNATLLVCHEIDSAYWREWELFRLPGGPGGFVLIHIPLVMFVIYGLIALVAGRPFGLIASLVVSLAGLTAFGLHGLFLARGRPEFRSPVSLGLLIGTVILSIAQLILTIRAW